MKAILLFAVAICILISFLSFLRIKDLLIDNNKKDETINKKFKQTVCVMIISILVLTGVLVYVLINSK